jgi:hypothetical protein
MNEHAKISSDYLVTKGENGLVYQVENELGGQWRGSPTLRVPNPTATAYMELLEDAVRANGIDVPLTQNQPNMNTYSWSEDWAPGAGKCSSKMTQGQNILTITQVAMSTSTALTAILHAGPAIFQYAQARTELTLRTLCRTITITSRLSSPRSRSSCR